MDFEQNGGLVIKPVHHKVQWHVLVKTITNHVFMWPKILFNKEQIVSDFKSIEHNLS